MSQEKGIQTSVTSLTSGVHSQLVSNSSKMFSKFKVEKPSHVLYKRGARYFEAEKSSNTLFLPSVETYEKQIRLMRAEIERLKTMKPIDQVIIQRNWHSLELKRSSYNRRSSFRVTVWRKEWKKNAVRKICCRFFFSFRINSSTKNKMRTRSPMSFFVLSALN